MVRFVILFFAALGCAAAPIDIYHFGDVHSADATLFVDYALTNSPKLVLSTGDNYEQQSVTSPAAFSNNMARLTAGGIMTDLPTGNHDCDQTNTPPFSSGSRGCLPGNEWNVWFPVSWFQSQTNIAGVGYIGEMDSGDSKVRTMTYTNQGIKLVFITMTWATNLVSEAAGVINEPSIRAAYLSQVQYVTNTLGQFPDHYGIVMTHYMMNTNRELAYWDTGNTLYSNIGPAQALFDDMNGTIPTNLLLVLSGHNRIWLKDHKHFTNSAGNYGCVVEWNTQNYENQCDAFDRISIDPQLRRIFFSTYDIDKGRYLTNGEEAVLATITNNPVHNFSMTLPALSGQKMLRAFRLQ